MMTPEQVREVMAGVSTSKPGTEGAAIAEALTPPTAKGLTDVEIRALLDAGYRIVQDGDGLRLLPPKRKSVDAHRRKIPNEHTKPKRDPAKAKAKRKAARRARRRNRR